MATNKKAGQENEAAGGDTPQAAAKAIAPAPGTSAATTGIAHRDEKPKKAGKFVKTGKKRLPRKEKKRAQKAARAQG
jgi:hypothetical protein